MRKLLIALTLITSIFASCGGGQKEITAEDQQQALVFRDTLIGLNNRVIDSLNMLFDRAGSLGLNQLDGDDSTITFDEVSTHYKNSLQTLDLVQDLVKDIEEFDPEFDLKGAFTTFNKKMRELIEGDFKKFMGMLENGINEENQDQVAASLNPMIETMKQELTTFRIAHGSFDSKYRIES